MRPIRKKRTNIFGIFVLLLIVASVIAFIMIYKSIPKPQQVSVKTAAPSPTLSPSPAPQPQEIVMNPVAAMLEGFKNVWSRSFLDFETLAMRDDNKIALASSRLALTLANADVMQPAQKLGALSQSGTDLWTGESAEKLPMPAFISGSGVTYSFGINVPDTFSQDAQKQEDGEATQTSLKPTPKSKATMTSLQPTPTLDLPWEADNKLEGRMDRQTNKLAYSAYENGELRCSVELVQSGAGYIGQIYRPKGANKGVTRFCVQLSMVSCAMFPDLDQKTMGSLYDEASTWAVLSEGAEQCMTYSNGTVELTVGDTLQRFQ